MGLLISLFKTSPKIYMRKCYWVSSDGFYWPDFEVFRLGSRSGVSLVYKPFERLSWRKHLLSDLSSRILGKWKYKCYNTKHITILQNTRVKIFSIYIYIYISNAHVQDFPTILLEKPPHGAHLGPHKSWSNGRLKDPSWALKDPSWAT